MATAAPAATSIETLRDLVDRLGGVPLDRIRFRPAPGTATIQDVEEVDAKGERLCELVEGVLVEKAVRHTESFLAGEIIWILKHYLKSNNIGYVTAPDGGTQLVPALVRMPDVAFIDWDRCPNRERPTDAYPLLAPNLAVEVLSNGNRPGEMAVKRQEYFDAGVELVWEVDANARTVAVYVSPDDSTTLTEAETLDGGAVLPGFSLALKDLFSELDRHG